MLYGLGSIDQGHTADEFIAVDQLEKDVKVYNMIIEEISLWM